MMKKALAEQVLGKVVQFFSASTWSSREVQSLFQAKSVAKSIIRSGPSNTRFTVPIGVTVGKLVHRAVNEHVLCTIEREPTPSASNCLFPKGIASPVTEQLKLLSNSESHKVLCRCRRSSSWRSYCEKLVPQGRR